jgi:SAM-dependent methyltransferase
VGTTAGKSLVDNAGMPRRAADIDAVMGVVQQLTVSMETLAAVGAHLRIEAESLDVDPRVAALLSGIAEQAGFANTSLEARQAALGFIRAFFRLAGDLLDDPAREPGWSHGDPAVLQSIGRGSATIADVIASASDGLDGLGAKLAREGASILDVGAGTGWLAIALAETFAPARVVGIDIWEPALALARENVEQAGVSDRVEIRHQDATTLLDVEEYDLVWLACPFLPVDVLQPAIACAFDALRHGGWMVLGLFGGPDDTIASLLADLRTVRSGGHPWTVEELLELAITAGLDDTREVPKTWNAPVRIVVGRRP